MSKIEMVLVTAGVLLMALAAALLVVYRRAADCVDVTTLHCHDVAFAYEVAASWRCSQLFTVPDRCAAGLVSRQRPASTLMLAVTQK